MTKQEFKAKHHFEFLHLGFTEVDSEKDPLTFYEKKLVSQEVIDDNELEEDEIPTLFFGTSGLNSGYGVFTGSCTIWLNVETPTEAINFADKISSFEPV